MEVSRVMYYEVRRGDMIQGNKFKYADRIIDMVGIILNYLYMNRLWALDSETR